VRPWRRARRGSATQHEPHQRPASEQPAAVGQHPNRQRAAGQIQAQRLAQHNRGAEERGPTSFAGKPPLRSGAPPKVVTSLRSQWLWPQRGGPHERRSSCPVVAYPVPGLDAGSGCVRSRLSLGRSIVRSRPSQCRHFRRSLDPLDGSSRQLDSPSQLRCVGRLLPLTTRGDEREQRPRG
jgi:hypothetical protein